MNNPQFGSAMPQQPFASAAQFGPPFNGVNSGTDMMNKHQMANGPPQSNGPAPWGQQPLPSSDTGFQQKPPNYMNMAAPQVLPNQLSQQVGAMRISQPRPTGMAPPNSVQWPARPPFGQQPPPPQPGYGPPIPPDQQSLPHMPAAFHPQQQQQQQRFPGPPPPASSYGPPPQPPQAQMSGPPPSVPASGYARPPPLPHQQAPSRTNGPSRSQYPPMQGRYPLPQEPQQQQLNQGAQIPPMPMQQQNQQNQQQMAAQSQGRRLDPDQMPSPIQVIEDDRKQRTGSFFTSTPGQVPPLVTTDFVVHDEGISGPRFVRSTIYNVPCLPDLLKQTSVPFAISVCPLARTAPGEMEPPISNLGDVAPVRCIRCKAYMCAFMQFIDGGRRFQCVFCKATTEVPPEYFAHLDHTGQRTDKFERPELCLGSYEFVATKEYCRKETFPNAPAFIFAMEVSFNSISNGVLHLICNNMKRLLSSLPKESGAPKSAIRVGFITYNSVVHFFNVKGSLAQPQMLVVSDVQDMFMPLLDGFLVTLDEADEILDSLLEQIPLMFGECRDTEVVLGPVIQAGLEALKAADCAGKLFVFHTSLPICEAPGKLGNRDDRKLLGTDKEKVILTPQNVFYNTLGQECVAAACCVDLFLFPNSYVDVATIGQVCRLTGGDIYKYAFFKAQVDGPQFLADLQRDIEKPIAFDAIMRVRTSAGIRPTDFFGNFFMSNTTDVELAAVDCDKALSIEIGYDDRLSQEEGVYLQVALLYTSCGGQRRLRLHNLALGACAAMGDLYRSCELDTIINFFAKQGLRMLLEKVPKAVKDNYVSRSAQILASYRKHCASPSSSGQLILPECMKLLPLYMNCLIKSDAMAGGPDMSTDDRSFAMMCVNSMDVSSSVGYFYPRLLTLHTLDPQATDMPLSVRCSAEKLTPGGAFLLENGIYMFLWVGQTIDQAWLQDVFAVQSPNQIDIEKPNLIEVNTPLSLRVRDVIKRIRLERKRHMRLVVVRQGDKLDIVFRQFLVEDRGSDGSTSYVDFLCHLHKEIRNLLS